MFAVKSDNLDSYSRFVDLTNKYVSYSLVRGDYTPFKDMISIYENVFIYLIEDNKRNEWLEINLENYELYSLKSSIYSNEDSTKILIGSYFSVLEFIVKSGEVNQYFKMLKRVFALINRILTDKVDSSVLNFIQINFIQHNKIIVKEKDNDILDIYLDNIFDLTDRNIIFGHQEFYTISAMTIYSLKNEYQDHEIKEKLNDYEFKIVSQYLNKGNDINVLYIPDYNEYIKENNYQNEVIENISEKYVELFRKSLLKNHSEIFNHLLYKYNTIFNDLDIQKKTQQSSIVKAYYKLFNMTITLKQDQNFHILLDYFFDAIFDLDNKNGLSKGIVAENT